MQSSIELSILNYGTDRNSYSSNNYLLPLVLLKILYDWGLPL